MAISTRLFAASSVLVAACTSNFQGSNDRVGIGPATTTSSPPLAACNVVRLVSDQPGAAAFQDADLVNPWGLAIADQALWIADNGSGRMSVVDATGMPTGETLSRIKLTLEEGITGIATNASSTAFLMHGSLACASARFLVASETGKIFAINQAASPTPLVVVDRSAQGAVYKGLAIVATTTNTGGPGPLRILASDFHNARIDVFDESFQLVDERFAPPSLPAGMAPFGVAMIAGQVYVTYAVQDADRHDDVSGAGNGRIDVFDADGHFMKTLVDGGLLNSPWGMALAASSMCNAPANALLVGNFGDGTIVAIDPPSGRVLGQLITSDGKVLAIDGLWSLMFGNGKDVGSATDLFFTAGPNDESDGLFGRIESLLKQTP